MGKEDDIVFEDLHGLQEDEPITVDLDADSKSDGITRAPAAQAADDDDGDDDDAGFDNLRSADEGDEPDADDQGDEDGDASKDGEDDDYSKKVRARIAREKRLTKKERERAEYWEQQARKLAKDQHDTRKRQLERSVEQADSDIEQVQADLEKAIEDGDTKGQVRLTNRLTDLKAAKARAEVSLEDLPDDGNVQPFDGKVVADRDKTQSLADNWTDAHSDWYGAKGFERQTRLANRLDKEVYRDGYDPNTPEYFEELDRRIKEREPNLYDDLDAADDAGKKDDKDEPPKRGKNIVTPVTGNEGNRQRTRSSKVDLGPEDFKVMRQFNLDTNDPEVLKEFARNKREAEGGR